MAATYKSLEGKVINFINREGDKKSAIIAGCNKDIGITIKEYNKNGTVGSPLFCWHGPSSVKSRKEHYSYTKADWLSFKHMIKMLRNGYFSEKEDADFDISVGLEVDFNCLASEESCPFGQ
jgi:hypothetical protein